MVIHVNVLQHNAQPVKIHRHVVLKSVLKLFQFSGSDEPTLSGHQPALVNAEMDGKLGTFGVITEVAMVSGEAASSPGKINQLSKVVSSKRSL